MPRATREYSFFPNPFMSLYSVKLTYKIVVDASSQSNAYQIACKRMREKPENFIAEVSSGGGERRSKPLWKQLLFGN